MKKVQLPVLEFLMNKVGSEEFFVNLQAVYNLGELESSLRFVDVDATHERFGFPPVVRVQPDAESPALELQIHAKNIEGELLAGHDTAYSAPLWLVDVGRWGDGQNRHSIRDYIVRRWRGVPEREE